MQLIVTLSRSVWLPLGGQRLRRVENERMEGGSEEGKEGAGET